MKQVRMGLAGFGGRGARLAHTAQRTTDGLMQAVAVVEPSDPRYEQSCREYNGRLARYGSVREMAVKENIDVLLIASPNEFHLDNLREMEGLRIPVLVEKPLDATWENICAVVRFGRQYAAPILVGHCMRYAPILQKAKELIQAGALGKIGAAHFFQYCHYGNAIFHTWRRERRRSGGQMIEKATHDFDVMQWLLSARPASVFASARLVAYGGGHAPELRCKDCSERLTCPESPTNIQHRWVEGEAFPEISHMDDALCSLSTAVDVPDDEVCLTQFDSGIHATYCHSYYTPRGFHHRVYQIVGTLGSMEIDLGAEHGGHILLCERYGSTNDKTEYHFDYLQRNHYNGDGAMTRHLYDVVTGGTPPQTTLDQAFLAEALGHAANHSARDHRLVPLTELVPRDLADVWNKPVFPRCANSTHSQPKGLQ